MPEMRVARDLPVIGQTFALDLPENCRRFARDIQRLARDLPKIFQSFAQDLTHICQSFARDLPEICQRFAQDCLKLARAVGVAVGRRSGVPMPFKLSHLTHLSEENRGLFLYTVSNLFYSHNHAKV